MIEVSNLTKKYAGVTAVDRISFKVEKGEIIGFLGKNGAGKSTTMKILSSFFPPTSGSARVAGFDCVTESMEVRRRVGYMPERVPIYEDMRVEEYLSYRARLKGVPWGERRHAVDESIVKAGLKDVRRKLVGALSKGYRQRAGLADAIVHKPELLILDEPTAGLDPGQIRQVRDLIKDLGKRTTLLLSTHILSEVELAATRVLMIHRGKIVATGTPGSLVGGMTSNRNFVIELRGAGVLAEAMFRGMPGVLKVEWQQGEEWQIFRIETRHDRDPRVELAGFSHDNGWELRELREERQTLEDLFIQITRTDEAGTAPPAMEPNLRTPAPAPDGGAGS